MSIPSTATRRRLPAAGLKVTALVTGLLAGAPAPAASPDFSDRYVVMNLQRHEIDAAVFERIASLAESRSPHAPRIGAAAIVSYFAGPPAETLTGLQKACALAEKFDLPLLVQLDGEQHLSARPDLWNWWDPQRPGYDPANAANVEWSGWSPGDALKIAWRNWGREHRIAPPPNLMSPAYRAAVHEAMAPLLAETMRWRQALGEQRKDLLIGVKVGWESSIGVNAYYYPGGNALLDADPTDDPSRPVQATDLPARGFAPIGYAAVSTAGLASSGKLQETDLAEVTRIHLADLAATVRRAGLPREQVFSHGGGWAEGESLYGAALNSDSCPGWSFYDRAVDPRRDRTAMAAAKRSDAPWWAAAEWLPLGAKTADDWSEAVSNTLSIARCRYVCIYNWRDVAKNPEAIAGIQSVLQHGVAAEEVHR